MNFYQKKVNEHERNLQAAKKSVDVKGEAKSTRERDNYVELLNQSKGK